MRFYIIDAWMLLFISIIARIGVRDAFAYKKSRSHIKKELKDLGVLRRITRAYPTQSSKAPRHMTAFQCVRIVNLLFFAAELIVLIRLEFSADPVLIGCIIAKWVLFYLPLILYVLIALHSGKDPHIMDFSRFRAP